MSYNYTDLIRKWFPSMVPILKRIRFLYQRFKSKKKWAQLYYKKEVLLELGSGVKIGKNGWVTIDVNGADITWDLRDGIPLRDGSVDMIYCSHLLEHIPFNSLVKLLSECHRVLKKHGEFSVCVPNFRYYVDAYMSRKYFISIDQCYKPAVVNTGSYIDQLNYMMYMNQEHKFMFDEENIINILKLSGFKKPEIRVFNPMLDLEGRDFESLYAKGIK